MWLDPEVRHPRAQRSDGWVAMGSACPRTWQVFKQGLSPQFFDPLPFSPENVVGFLPSFCSLLGPGKESLTSLVLWTRGVRMEDVVGEASFGGTLG